MLTQKPTQKLLGLFSLVAKPLPGIKGKMDNLKQNSSVRPQDLEALESLLDKKDQANFDWNMLEVLQQRISKKVNFMAEFIKDKQDILKEKKVLLEKGQIQLGELQDLVKSTMKELKGSPISTSEVEIERHDVESQLGKLKKSRQTLLAKIDLNKKEISKIRAATSSEGIKVQNLTEDLEMLSTELNLQKEKSAKLADDAERIEKRYQNFTADRNAGLEVLLKQELEDLLLNEKKTIMASISKVAEPTQVGEN
jgi:chromosome segregation ATPase